MKTGRSRKYYLMEAVLILFNILINLIIFAVPLAVNQIINGKLALTDRVIAFIIGFMLLEICIHFREKAYRHIHRRVHNGAAVIHAFQPAQPNHPGHAFPFGKTQCFGGKLARFFFLQCQHTGVQVVVPFPAFFLIADHEPRGFVLYFWFVDIPIRQETIEICEFFNINPYLLDATGCLFVVVEDGEITVQIARRFIRQNQFGLCD